MRVMYMALAMLAADLAEAQEFPTTGLLYNRDEDASITHYCNKTNDGKLHCKFIQTAVRRKAKPGDLDGKLAEAKKEFPSAVKEMSHPKECKQVANLIDMIAGSLSPDKFLKQNPGFASDRDAFIEGIVKSRAKYAQHPDEIDPLQALSALCEKKDEESYLNVVRLQHERDVRTCRVSSNPFEQTFTWINSYISGKGAWVVEGRPEGPCGTVQLSRFEPDVSNISSSKFTFWRYVARKAVTNPDGEIFTGQKCSAALDQGEYVYDWRQSRDPRIGCEFIEFSPF